MPNINLTLFQKATEMLDASQRSRVQNYMLGNLSGIVPNDDWAEALSAAMEYVLSHPKTRIHSL
jgi:hypothetical protein